MASIAQTIAERHIGNHARRHSEEQGTMRDAVENVLLFLATPFIGLAFALTYGLLGMAVAVCYGLKAFGVKCGVFRA